MSAVLRRRQQHEVINELLAFELTAFRIPLPQVSRKPAAATDYALPRKASQKRNKIRREKKGKKTGR